MLLMSHPEDRSSRGWRSRGWKGNYIPKPPGGTQSASYTTMWRDESQNYVHKRLLPLLLDLLANVRCAYCGLSGDEHKGADHFLVDLEDDPDDHLSENAL